MLLVTTMLLGFSSGILTGFLYQQHRQVGLLIRSSGCGALRRAQLAAGLRRNERAALSTGAACCVLRAALWRHLAALRLHRRQLTPHLPPSAATDTQLGAGLPNSQGGALLGAGHKVERGCGI